MPVLLTRAAFVCGLALFVWSVAAPWFSVPVAFAPGAEGGIETVTAEAGCAWTCKAAIAAGAACVIGWCGIGLRWRRQSRARDRAATAAIILAAVTLAFPFFAFSRGGEAGEAAARLQMQHENLTWLGGDIYNAQEYSYQPRKSAVQLKDTPRVLAPFPVPALSPATLRLSDVNNLFLWAGYTPAFFQFAGRGWFCALFGSLMILASLCRSDDGAFACREDLRFSARLAKRGGAALLAVVAVVTLPVFSASAWVRAAEKSVAAGEFARARGQLEAAIAWLPALRYHTDIVAQLGAADAAAGREGSSHALLWKGYLLEKGGYFQQATQIYRGLGAGGTGEGVPVEVAREARRALLREAVNRYNAGKIQSARALLDWLHGAEPVHLKVNYALQLACLQLGKTDALRQCHEELRALYATFRSKNKRAVLSASHHNLAEAGFDEGAVAEVVRQLDKMLRP